MSSFPYFDGFENEEDLKEQFCIDRIEGEVLIAVYWDDPKGYDGEAFVLIRHDGRYYEVNASHCSCMGLEDQWDPELADLPELYQRSLRPITDHVFNSDVQALLAYLAAPADS